jgi:hypothetical protein
MLKNWSQLKIQRVTLLNNILRFGLETEESGSGSRSSDEVDRQAPAEPLDLSIIPQIVLTPYKTKTTESLAQQAAPTAATADITPTATTASATAANKSAATPGTASFTAVAAAAATAIAATAKTATFTAVTAALAATGEVRAAVPGRNNKVWNEPTYPVGEVCLGDYNPWISASIVHKRTLK